MGSIPGPGRSPGVGNGTPLQYSSLGNHMDREAWWSTVHGVAKELDMTEHTYTHDMGLDHQSEKTTSQKDRAIQSRQGQISGGPCCTRNKPVVIV